MSTRRVYDAGKHGLTGDGVTNDQPALAALVDRLGDAYRKDGCPRVIWVPAGDYLVQDEATVWRSGVSLVGASMHATRFLLANPGARGKPTPLMWFTTAQHGAGQDNYLADCTFAGFEVDGSGMELDEYDPLAKGLGLQYVLRGRFRDLWVHDTPATGFGCDFLQDCVVDAVLAERCGRSDTGEQPGGAGIGIGIGGWGSTERVTVTACTARGNGTNGIFVELQRQMWPPPRGVRITACHVEDNRFGISDWGADGLVVTGCTMIGNHEAGFDISAKGTSGMAGRGGMVVNCIIDGNLRDGVGIGNTPGPYMISGSRISANGRYGYWQHPFGQGYEGPAVDLVLDGNSIRDNGLDGIRVDAAVDHSAFTRNRIRNNGRRTEPETAGGGAGVSYGDLVLTDETADWRPDGHRGKRLTVGREVAVVLFNTGTTLGLAPHRPGAGTAWRHGRPAEGTTYRLPGSPRRRPGITLDAPVGVLDLDGNRIWDDQEEPSQSHAAWTTERAFGAIERAQKQGEGEDGDD
ncbi:right-handed parallel beta-helix repeat-containing protein [Streptomyces griseoluteus]|uniref:right-handed parallel beta-helix repeat-containing protein n=1 Tax=Streptomyces griseoluteus TaxID=29306 RepID=UPI0033FC5BE7